MHNYRVKRLTMTSGLKRRGVLRFLGGTIAVTLVGCLRNPSDASESSPLSAQSTAQTTAQPTTAATTAPPGCLVRPEQTEGPFFVDERLNRSDVRSDPADGVLRGGVPLQLSLRVSQVSNNTCTPLVGAIVDIWHCDAEGVYSDVASSRSSTVGQKFLRGYQVTDADGTVQFTTIYPGWYPGRTIHIHFKIRSEAGSQSYEFISQLYFDDQLSDRILTQSPYAARGPRNRRNDQDGLFQAGGEQLLLSLTPLGEGYGGTFEIGLQV